MRRHINLNQNERTALADNLQLEQAVALFLDLTEDHTWPQIADALGLALAALKRLTQTAEFQRVYDDALATVGHDPRLNAVKSSLGDLLPMAYRRLQSILGNPRSDDRTAMRAIEKLFSWTGVDSGTPQDDPAAFQNFLHRFGVNVEGNLNVINAVNIPQEYQAAFAKFLQPENVEAAIVNSVDEDSVEEEMSEVPHGAQSDEKAETNSDVGN